MKRIILILIIALIAMTTLLADTVTSQTSRDIPGRIRGYVYQSYYPNGNSTTPLWRAKANENVLIVVRNEAGTQLESYLDTTGVDGFYTSPSWNYLSSNQNYTVSVTCHGLTKTALLNDTNRFDFYIDVEF